MADDAPAQAATEMRELSGYHRELLIARGIRAGKVIDIRGHYRGDREARRQEGLGW